MEHRYKVGMIIRVKREIRPILVIERFSFVENGKVFHGYYGKRLGIDHNVRDTWGLDEDIEQVG